MSDKNSQQELSNEEQWVRSQALSRGTGQYRTTCPFCSEKRKPHNKKDPCMSIEVTEKEGVFNCWHCTATGHVWLDGLVQHQNQGQVREATPIKIVAGELSDAAQRFLKHRGISLTTAKRLGLFSAMRYSRKAKGEAEAIGFPYQDAEDVYAVKYRIIEPKDFSWDGTPHSMWGMDRVELSEDEITEEFPPLIITEGEMDALTLAECGIQNAVSVPHGAPNAVAKVGAENDKRFAFLWAARDAIKDARKIVICADGDEQGAALAEELARRVGRAKCWTVEYPDGCKDLNDVLMKHGREAVVGVLSKMVPWPVAGLFAADHYSDAVKELYLSGPGSGESTGYADVDEIYTITGGQVTIVTGIPGSGKSEFIDQLMYNLAENLHWKFGICSFENPPAFHIPKLAEKYIQKPFFEGPSQRMSALERDSAMGWVNNHFVFMDHSDGEPATIENILDRGAAAVLRLGIRGLVIDPFNYIDISQEKDSETNVISNMITKVRAFAISHDVHVWFIAHPLKLRATDGSGIPVPTGYDKADFGMTVVRPWMHSPVVADQFGNKAPKMVRDNNVEIQIWKCRFKWMGCVGAAKLEYNPINGTYGQYLDWDDVGI